MVEADQVDTESESVTRSYATSPSTADAVGDRWSAPPAQSDAELGPDSSDAEDDNDEVVLVDQTDVEMPTPAPVPPATDLLAEFRPDVPAQAPPTLFDQVLEAAETE